MSQDDPDWLRITRDVKAGTYALTMVMDLACLSELDQPEGGDVPDSVNLTELVDRVGIRVAVTFPGEEASRNYS